MSLVRVVRRYDDTGSVQRTAASRVVETATAQILHRFSQAQTRNDRHGLLVGDRRGGGTEVYNEGGDLDLLHSAY